MNKAISQAEYIDHAYRSFEKNVLELMDELNCSWEEAEEEYWALQDMFQETATLEAFGPEWAEDEELLELTSEPWDVEDVVIGLVWVGGAVAIGMCLGVVVWGLLW